MEKRGTMVRYFPNRGYGFIKSEGSYYMFSSRDWNLVGKPEEGTKVIFEAINTEKGKRARKVTKWQTK